MHTKMYAILCNLIKKLPLFQKFRIFKCGKMKYDMDRSKV